MLRGANIYISEDFSKRVRDQVNLLLTLFRTAIKLLLFSALGIAKVYEIDETTKTQFKLQPAI